jgi:hypothetical protein
MTQILGAIGAILLLSMFAMFYWTIGGILIKEWRARRKDR